MFDFRLSEFSLKKQSNIFNNLSLLIYQSFVKDGRNYVFMIILPILFSLMFFFIFGQQGSYLLRYSLLPCITILTSLTPAIVEWKNSVFLRRIDITGVKKGMFIAALWTVYLISGLLFYLVIFAFNLCISLIFKGVGDSNDFINGLKHIRFGYFILSIALTCAISLALATFLAGIFDSVGAIQGIIIVIYFFSLFLSGLMLPNDALFKNQGMVWFTYAIPHKYPVFLYMYSLSGTGWTEAITAPWFTETAGPNVTFQGLVNTFTATWEPIVYSLVIIVGLLGLTLFSFKWAAKR